MPIETLLLIIYASIVVYVATHSQYFEKTKMNSIFSCILYRYISSNSHYRALKFKESPLSKEFDSIKYRGMFRKSRHTLSCHFRSVRNNLDDF